MDDRLRALRDLEAKPVDRLLEELGDLARREKLGEKVAVPLVTLHLRTGRDVRGWVLEVASGRGGPGGSSVLVHSPGPDPRSVDYDAVYVAMSSVEAVTVHDVPGLAKAPPDARPLPTRLELKRQVAALQERLSVLLGGGILCEVSWDAVPESGEPLRSLGDLIDQTTSVLEELAKDELGLATLKTKVKKLWFGMGSKPSASVIEGTTLIVTTTPGWAARMTRADLKRSIEASL